MRIVRCIEDGPHCKFKKGQTCTVLREFEGPVNKVRFYTFVDDHNASYPVDWFEEIYTPNFTDAFSGISQEKLDAIYKAIRSITDDGLRNFISSSKPQDEETRLRNLLRPTILPGQCPCGIDRKRCGYHK